MGRNHIDARLGAQCNYGVLDPYLGPTPGARGLGSGTPIPWDPGLWDIPCTGIPVHGMMHHDASCIWDDAS